MATPAAVLSIIVEAQTSKATTALRKFERDLQKIDREDAEATLGADVDEGGFKVHSDLVKKAGAQRADSKLGVDLDVASFAKANAAITALDARDVDIDMDFDRSVLGHLSAISAGITNLGSAATGAGGDVGGFGLKLGALGGSLGPMLPVLAAAVVAVGALGAALATVAASLAVATAAVGALAAAAGSLLLPAITLGIGVVQRWTDTVEKAGTAAHELRNVARRAGSAFNRMIAPGADAVFRGASDALRAMLPTIRALRPAFTTFGRAVGGALRRLGEEFSSPTWRRFFGFLARSAAKVTPLLTRGFIAFARIMRNIAEAAMPFLIKGLREFTRWLEKAAKGTKDIDLSGIMAQLGAWLELSFELGKVFLGFIKALAPAGKGVVDWLTKGAEALGDWVNSAKGTEGIQDFMAAVLPLAKELATLFVNLVKVALPLFTAIAAIATPVLRGLNWIITGLSSIKVGNVSALTGLIGAFIAFRGVQAGVSAVQSLTDAIGGIPGKIGAARGALRKLSGGLETLALKGMYAKDAALEWVSTMASNIRAKGAKVRDAIRATLTKARVFISTAATGAAEFIGSMVGSIRSSKLASKLRGFFRAVAIQMGKIMAAATAAAVVVGEGIGGIGASLAGVLRRRLPGKMTKVGRVAGRAFGTGMLVGILAAIPLIVTMVTNKIRDELLGGERDTSKGGGLFGGGISLGPLDDVSGWLQEHGGRSPVGHKGGLVTRDGIVPQGFQHGGMVGKQGLRPGTGDTIPALLEVGELVIPKKMVDTTRKNAKLTAGAMTGELGKGHKKAAEDTDKFVRGHDKAWDKLRQMTSKTTQRFRKGTVDDFQKTSKDATDQTQKMRGNVTDGFGKMREQSQAASQKMKEGMSRDFRDLGGAVRGGLQRIGRMTNNALDALGVKKVQFNISAQGKQRGGLIGGIGDGDKVPVLAEPGEGFINKKAVKAMGGKAAIDKLNRAVPRFAKGGTVGGLNFALGPYDIPPIKYAADHAGGNSHVHITGTTTPWVVGIGRQLQRMGFMVGEHPAFGGVNARHSATGGHYDALAIDVNSAVDETQAEVAQIARLLKTGAAGAVAEKIKRVLLEGPKGPLKDMGQAALDKVRKAANDLIAKKTPTGVAGGITGDGDVERIFARAAKRLSTSKTATLALGMAGYAESGMRDLSYGDSTSQGALQLLASTAAGMNINPHDEGAIASAFLLRGFYGRGGANQLAASGLPAHLVAQSVQGSAFSSGSNYAAQESSARSWMQRFGLRRGGMVPQFQQGGTLDHFAGRVWNKVAPMFGTGFPQPKIGSGPTHGHWSWWSPRNAKINVSKRFREALMDKEGNRHYAALQDLVHEFAHANQDLDINRREREGGADLFADWATPKVMRALGVKYKDAPFGYAGAAGWVRRKHGGNWWKGIGPDEKTQFRQMGGMVAPFVGSFDKGGTVGQTGLGLLHKGEHVLSMQKGGTVDDEFIRLPRWLENFQRWMKQLNNDLRRVTKNLETQLSQEQRKRLKKLERVDPEDRTKKQKRELDHLRELTKTHDKLTKAQRRERVQLQRNLRDHGDNMKKMKKAFGEDGKLSKAEKDKLKAAREEHRANRDRLDLLNQQRRLHRREERREERIGRRQRELESQKALTEQLKELRGEIKEQNKNYKTIKASEKVALNAMANLVNAQIGAKGLERGRLAAAGSVARY